MLKYSHLKSADIDEYVMDIVYIGESKQNVENVL